MFDSKAYYSKYNTSIQDNYNKSLIEIRSIVKETKGCDKCKGKKDFCGFFSHTAAFILRLADMESTLDDDYFIKKSFDELKEENKTLYSELLPESYQTSYANPTYAVSVLGEKWGQLFSYFYRNYRDYISYAFRHRIYRMYEYNELFIKVFSYVRDKDLDYEEIKALITGVEFENLQRNSEISLNESYSRDFSFSNDVFENRELGDLRYLYRFGEYITENEIELAQFMAKYPQDKLETLSDSIVKAYINGFIRENKDITKRSTVRVFYNIGLERLLNQLLKDFRKNNLEGFVFKAVSTEFNKQYDYDHRFDNALFLNEQYAELMEESYGKAAGNCKDMLEAYSGIMYFDKFGEAPFAPESKPERLKLSDEQSLLVQHMKNSLYQIREKFMPQTEVSFCIVAFPTPEIGEKFEEIFEDIVQVNMLDSSRYEMIQQVIIDILDKGKFVHIKGKGQNITDIKVRLHQLGDTNKETNFVNCVADVNIPVGEVFTSPVLKDTNGILHLEEIFLDGLKYIDMKLTFSDGYITDYTCRNLNNEEENRRYIEENLLFPHKTLPIGEFAIGTNTLAYVMAQKYGIVDLLPVLIIEKMGPHFAIGDTCFSWAEDVPMHNMTDKKEVIARDNEKSILRKTNINEAYTNVHTDITLPYDALEFISILTDKGEVVDIIRNGRFTLKGTEELNKPFGL